MNHHKNAIVPATSSAPSLHKSQGETQREQEAIVDTREEAVRQAAAIRAREIVQGAGAEAAARMYIHTQQLYDEATSSLLTEHEHAVNKEQESYVHGYGIALTEELQRDLSVILKTATSGIKEITAMPTYQSAPPKKKGFFGRSSS